MLGVILNRSMEVKPVQYFSAGEIRDIRKRVKLSQRIFAGLMGVSKKTIEAWEHARTKPEGAARRLLEVVREEPGFLIRFQSGERDEKI